MKYIRQFLIIIVISFIGEIFHEVLPLPIPASIYGIIIMFLCLEFHIIPLSSVKEAGNFLVEIMPIMFIPAGVGLISVWDIIKPSWIVYILITFLSTCIVLIFTGKVSQVVIQNEKKKQQKEATGENE
ncbi:MAG: CidA/LrgA family protein [Lachnospiraceae bacterium]|nr:CidA/LrgA family protein [Lachnospiraceae bacterium]